MLKTLGLIPGNVKTKNRTTLPTLPTPKPKTIPVAPESNKYIRIKVPNKHF
jgi:hypothetical protein